jgi:hypothetical protein
MSTPIVTEIIRPPEPVTHDTFIDDLEPKRAAAGSTSQRS